MLQERGGVLPAQVVALLVVQRLERSTAEAAVERAVLPLRLAELVHQEVHGIEAGVGGWGQRDHAVRLPLLVRTNFGKQSILNI